MSANPIGTPPLTAAPPAGLLQQVPYAGAAAAAHAPDHDADQQLQPLQPAAPGRQHARLLGLWQRRGAGGAPPRSCTACRVCSLLARHARLLGVRQRRGAGGAPPRSCTACQACSQLARAQRHAVLGSPAVAWLPRACAGGWLGSTGRAERCVRRRSWAPSSSWPSTCQQAWRRRRCVPAECIHATRPGPALAHKVRLTVDP